MNKDNERTIKFVSGFGYAHPARFDYKQDFSTKSDMEKIVNLDNVSEYNTANNTKTLHPLVSIIDFSKASPRG